MKEKTKNDARPKNSNEVSVHWAPKVQRTNDIPGILSEGWEVG